MRRRPNPYSPKLFTYLPFLPNFPPGGFCGLGQMSQNVPFLRSKMNQNVTFWPLLHCGGFCESSQLNETEVRRSGIGTQTTSVRPRQLGFGRRPTCPVSWGGRSAELSRVLNGSPAWGVAEAAPQWEFTSHGGVGRVFARKVGAS